MCLESRDYDICSGFGTLREWECIKDKIISRFVFKEWVTQKGDAIWESLPINHNKQTCSIHFRRTDYLVMSSRNLEEDYYRTALSYFDRNEVQFLVFSDDIEYCKGIDYIKGEDTIFVEGMKPAVDMYLMSKCDHNIIANSSFSLWGALLNGNEYQKVVCPKDFVGSEAKEIQYINGNWYPSQWIAI